MIPWYRAAEILLLGRPIDAQEAYRRGLVNKIVPPQEVMPTAKEWQRLSVKWDLWESEQPKMILTPA